jgi:hypothetical protein
LPVVLARKPKLLFGWWFACTIEDAMKILSTLAFSVVLGFAIVGLIRGDLFIVLTDFNVVRREAQLSCLIAISAGFVVSLLRDD